MTTTDSVADVAIDAARMLAGLPPGDLAEARRMDGGRVAPVFWRLAARHPETMGRGDREERLWTAIVAILARLTPRGESDEQGRRHFLHDRSRPLGAVLCDGGDPAWPGEDGGEPRPVLSELRLARLLASRGTQRVVHLRRAAMALSGSISPGSGLNVPDIAFALLHPERSNRAIARAYYARLDRAGSAGPRQKDDS